MESENLIFHRIWKLLLMWIKQIHFFELHYIVQYFSSLWRQEQKLLFDRRTSEESCLQYQNMRFPDFEERSNSYFKNVLALFLKKYLW